MSGPGQVLSLDAARRLANVEARAAALEERVAQLEEAEQRRAEDEAEYSEKLEALKEQLGDG